MDVLFLLVLAGWLVAGPLVALILVLLQRRRLNDLEARLRDALGPEVVPRRRRARPSRAPAAAGAPPAAGPAPPSRRPAGATGAEPSPPAPRPPAAPAAREARAEPPAGPAAAARVSLEERLGARLPVWIGGVAVALSGAFLFRYAIDQGWIGPPVRLALGLVFGAALLAAAEWIGARARAIAQSLAAAGVFVLFASLWYGVNRAGLIAPALGFVLMGLVTLAAVLLALRRGPFVAALGLVGGFLAPVLAGSGTFGAGGLFAYLLLLEAGLLVVTRRRRWWALALLTVAGALTWSLCWVLGAVAVGTGPWLGLLLVGTAGAAAWAGAAPAGGRAWRRVGRVPVGAMLTSGGVALALLVAGLALPAQDFTTRDWTFFVILCAGCVLTARLVEGQDGLAWLATSFALIALVGWGSSVEHLSLGRFAGVAVALLAVTAGGAWAALWGSARPARWAALSAIASVGHVTAAWRVITERDLDVNVPWGAIALAVAALHAVGVAVVARRRERLSQADGALAALAAGVTALVGLAIPFELEREWISVGWALEIPALALLERRLRVPALRAIAAVVAAAVVVRLVLNPHVLSYPIGEWLVLDWLLWGYGITLACFVVTARVLAEQRDDRVVQGLEAGAVALGAAWLALEIRHYFQGTALDSADFGPTEQGAVAAGFMLLGAVVLRLVPRARRAVLATAGAVVAAAGLLLFVLGPLLAANPLWTHAWMGETPLLNRLLVAHGLPTALALAAAAAAARGGWRLLGGAGRLVALVGLFAFVSLEVRQWFQGGRLDSGTTTEPEWWTYSAAWIALGVGLLVAGIRTASALLRHAALLVTGVAVVKVFLFDLRHLQDLWRVVSFLGLGLALLGLGWIYQRYVFRREG